MSDELLELAAECEALSGPNRDLDWVIADAVLGKVKAPYSRGKCEHYTASLDAALTLVPENTGWELVYRLALRNYAASVKVEGMYHICPATTPALALTAACLRAIARLRMEVE